MDNMSYNDQSMATFVQTCNLLFNTHEPLFKVLSKSQDAKSVIRVGEGLTIQRPTENGTKLQTMFKNKTYTENY